MNETIEGNKLIAEFMGLHLTVDNDNQGREAYWETKEGKWVDLIGAGNWLFETPPPFHSSWDWQMPVVGKITIWYDNESDASDVEDINKLKIFNLSIFASIKDVWLAVVEFIKWYNKNNK